MESLRWEHITHVGPETEGWISTAVGSPDSTAGSIKRIEILENIEIFTSKHGILRGSASQGLVKAEAKPKESIILRSPRHGLSGTLGVVAPLRWGRLSSLSVACFGCSMVVLGVHDKVGSYEAAGCSSEKRKVDEIFAWYDWTDVELVSPRARARGVAGRLASLEGLEALRRFLTNRKRCKIGIRGHPPPRLA